MGIRAYTIDTIIAIMILVIAAVWTLSPSPTVLEGKAQLIARKLLIRAYNQGLITNLEQSLLLRDKAAVAQILHKIVNSAVSEADAIATIVKARGVVEFSAFRKHLIGSQPTDFGVARCFLTAYNATLSVEITLYCVE